MIRHPICSTRVFDSKNISNDHEFNSESLEFCTCFNSYTDQMWHKTPYGWITPYAATCSINVSFKDSSKTCQLKTIHINISLAVLFIVVSNSWCTTYIFAWTLLTFNNISLIIEKIYFIFTIRVWTTMGIWMCQVLYL